jgi:hypothetical protein
VHCLVRTRFTLFGMKINMTDIILSDLESTYYKEWDLQNENRLEPLVKLLETYQGKALKAIDDFRYAADSSAMDSYDATADEILREKSVGTALLQQHIIEQCEQNAPLADCFSKYNIPENYAEQITGVYAKRTEHNYGQSNLLHLNKDECVDIAREVNRLTNNKLQRQTGCFWYPNKGYMDWHTNEDNTGYRIYIVYSENGDSFFRYMDPLTEEIITSYDNPGWNMRSFKVGGYNKPLWHCVLSNTDRISLGFNINT